MPLTKRTGIAFAAENVEGTPATLGASNTYEAVGVPEIAPDFEDVDRDLARATLTEDVPLSGRKSGPVTVIMEATGPSTYDGTKDTPVPHMGLPLEACGLRATLVQVVPIDPNFTTGFKMEHNEAVSDTSLGSSATGRLVGQILGRLAAGEDDLTSTPFAMIALDVDTTTFANADVLEDSVGNQVSVIIGSEGVRFGWAFEPFDKVLKKIGTTGAVTGVMTEGNILVGDTSGGRGYLWVDGVGGTFAGGSADLFYEELLASPQFTASEILYAYDSIADLETDEGPGGTLGTNSVGNVTTGGSATPRSHAMGSLTFRRQMPGLELQGFGERGNFELVLANGDRGLFTFSLDGGLSEPSEAFPPVDPQNIGDKPLVILGTSLLYDRRPAACFQTFTFRSESTQSKRECQQDDSGFKSTLLTDRKFTGETDPETISEGLFDTYGKAYNRTAFSVEFLLGHHPVADASEYGNRLMVRAPVTVPGSPSQGDRDGLATTTVPLSFHGLGVEDEFFIYIF